MQKRGMVFAVIVVLLLLNLALVSAPDSEGSEDSTLERYNSLVGGSGSYAYEPLRINHDNTCGGPNAAKYTNYDSCNDDDWINCRLYKTCDCDGDSGWWDTVNGAGQQAPAPKGCYFRAHDTGSIGDEPCGWIELREGMIIKKEREAIIFLETDYYNYGGDSYAYIFLRRALFTSPSVSYVCGNGHFWFECDADTPSDAVVYGGDNLYNCTHTVDPLSGAEEYKWVQVDKDQDRDGYTTVVDGDCKDTPETDNSCPVPDVRELQGLSIEEIRTKIKSEYCIDLANSKCAICINPDAPEVCGDGINNDCGGPGKHESVDELNGATSDNCNNNEAACTQTVPRGSNVSEFKNIFDQSFSWIPVAAGGIGYCCGYNGINDLGAIATQYSYSGQDNGNNYLCLNKDKNLVGFDGTDIPGWPQASGTTDSHCLGQWCWVNAIGDAQFKVLTIKKPLEQSYDVVSDSQWWHVCNNNTRALGPGEISPLAFDPVVTNFAPNHFYCYQEGQHWSWAECYGKGDGDTQVNENNARFNRNAM